MTPAHRILACALVFVAGAAGAHTTADPSQPVPGQRLLLKERKFVFRMANGAPWLPTDVDPRTIETGLLVSGSDGRSALIDLDPTLWRPIVRGKGRRARVVGYRYRDKSGAHGGVTHALLRDGRLTLRGRTEGLGFLPEGPQDAVWVHWKLDHQWYCSGFDGDAASENRRRSFSASNAPAPAACPEAVCGNGVLELGEDCDDGDLESGDGCEADCSVGDCQTPNITSTFEAIQSVIFDSPTYGCTTGICHGGAVPGSLDLREGRSYDALVNVPSQASLLPRVSTQAEPLDSFLYRKLAAATFGLAQYPDAGTPMPSGLPPLSEEHLRAVEKWIRGGAPRDRVVPETAELLESCLPEPDPLVVEPLDPPAPGEGVQLRIPARALPAQAESEICMATYFDFSGLVPPEARVPCSSRFQARKACRGSQIDCTDDASLCAPLGRECVFVNGVLNPGEECFAFKSETLLQDPQSHHGIVFLYTGAYPDLETGFGEFTYRFADASNPLQGQPCDPRAVDPALGFNPGCSSPPRDAVACIFYGPPDFSNFGSLFGQDGGTSPTLLVSQEPVHDIDFDPGVYDVMPVKGVLVWNSHAFNLTRKDSTLSGYWNLLFADTPADRVYPVQPIFDANDILSPGVAPFESAQFCGSWTAPEGARVFRMSSHTHKRGVEFLVWPPPNAPCSAGCQEGAPLCVRDLIPPQFLEPLCEGPRPAGEIIYRSTDYSDPTNLFFDPPRFHPWGTSVEERTYLYCATYDNGSTPQSPAVKLQSTSPPPPASIPLGGPCAEQNAYCANEGPSRGLHCAGDDALCDSSPGAGDGRCDACIVYGGVTTEDEMLVLFGDYYVVPPPESPVGSGSLP
jgi:cysteine-rich repeat protein